MSSLSYQMKYIQPVQFSVFFRYTIHPHIHYIYSCVNTKLNEKEKIDSRAHSPTRTHMHVYYVRFCQCVGSHIERIFMFAPTQCCKHENSFFKKKMNSIGISMKMNHGHWRYMLGTIHLVWHLKCNKLFILGSFANKKIIIWFYNCVPKKT